MIASGRVWLLVAGLAAVIGIHAALASHVSTVLADRYLQREAEVMQEFLTGILAADGDASNLFAAPAPSNALTSFGAHVRSLPGILRANIYAPDGFIRHSTEANLIGVQFNDNKELKESFSGKLVAKLEDFSSAGKDEHIALNATASNKLIEAYIPIRDADGQIATVVEFYKRDTAVRETVASISRVVWIAAAANALVLIAVFWLASRRRRQSPAAS